ncbi:hypothetical protein GCM10007036_28080 [Alsobacter metallidurans]|uniref:histidine kinase n=1 Tax=Alsobacter metallidurans TaxID=340221 RepID=A0A917MHV9_9HYPH|nr:response regulator [Alsobacter metallidurans]GGH22795.1 hypothetical protein GCM10007036_28080 [Alsobacter metallidurans]
MSDQDKVNILLVDDQPAKLLSYEVILEDLGETLLKASTAREAFEHLLRSDVAVVLMDVQMPELDGFELAALIREHPRFEKIAIIFVSAIHLTDLDRLRGYAAGAVDYVPVPVAPEMLRAKVRIFVDLYRKTRQLERMNEELERRVSERTAALEASSQALTRLNEELEVRIEERTREREAALAQLFEAQKMDTIGQLTGGVAHDFNNLLMAVLGSLELLRKRVTEERSLRLLDNATEGAQRGAALTKRLLAFARRQELKPESVAIEALFGGMEDLLRRAVGPAVAIEAVFEPDLPPIQVDVNQLELAFLNLAVNARDAMPDGGVLHISAERFQIETPTHDGLAPGEYLCVTVRDTGLGMDEATLAKAAEPFFTTKGPGKGTGLGLSMVHGMTAQSGGALRLSSKPGEGTTVHLVLPVASRDGLAARPNPLPFRETPAPATTTRLVLVVDDDALVRTGTCAMIEDLGHTVIEADSAAVALDLLKTNAGVELLLTDHAMPGMSGAELLLHVNELYPSVRAILASGYAELPTGPGPTDAIRLAKPFNQDELAAAISKALAAQPARPSIPAGR